MATTWLTDASAYLLGPLMGGPALPAWINSRKSWLGFVPGLLASSASGWAFAQRLGLTARQGAALGLGVGLSASAGDVVESILKRRAGVADSGHILPGYGGALDRLDSLLPSIALLCVAHLALRGRPSPP